MLKIGDFSRLAQVSIRTLRLYDELGLLKPASIDRFTDYRYYDLEQLPRLNRILALKDLGLSLDQIQQLLRHDLPADQLEGMLLLKQAEIEQHLQAERGRLQRVATRLRQIKQEGQSLGYDIVTKRADALVLASVRQTIPTISDMAQMRCSAFVTLYETLSALRIEASAPEMALYHNQEYREEDIDMAAAVAIADAAYQQRSHMPANITIHQIDVQEQLATVLHHGNVWGIADAMQALYQWVGANGLQSAGILRELHLGWRELDHTFSEPLVVELQLPVSE